MSTSANHIDTAESRPLYEADAPELRDVPAEDHPTIEPYLVDSLEPTSAIIVCPGGGYQRKAPHEAEPVARWLNGIGIAAFVLEYRVGMMGFSAGGHLAATAGTFPGSTAGERPDVLVLGYPVISFGEWAHEGSMTRLLGETNPASERRAELSAERYVSPQTPPTFLWHTADDPGVNVANSLEFADACNRHGVDFALHIFAHGRHGLGLADELPDVHCWTTLCADFLAARDFIG